MTPGVLFHVPVEVAGPTGAVAATRYAGGTASGAPVTGSFLKGDFIIDQAGKVWVCTTAGSPGTWADVGGGSGVSYATPAIVLGSSAAAGAAGTVIRSDGTIAAFDATNPSTQAFGDSAAVGSVAFAARRDHKHAMPATPVTTINKTGSTALTGAVTLTGGTNVTLTQSGQDISIAASGAGAAPIGSTALVYRYTVTGSDKASIDTGADTPDAGSNDWTNGDLLEIFLYARTDESVTSSQLQFIFNNDTTSIYDVTRLTGQNGGVSSASFASLGRFLADVPGASATASIFGVVDVKVPNFAGTVGFKAITLHQSLPEPSTSAMEYQSFAAGYRSASAISRFKVIPNVALKNLKVGSQLLIYKRLAS